MTTGPEEKKFTGRHMLIIMLSAFGVIIGVNLLMAAFALGTFPGTIVKNSYVASQQFGARIEAHEMRSALGWSHDLAHSDGRFILEIHEDRGMPVRGLSLAGVLGRPASALEDHSFGFTEERPGLYAADIDLAAGRWELRIEGHDHAGEPVVSLRNEIWIE